MNGRRIYHARGKVLGGSSSINGMIFQRGNPLDFERWAADPGMERVERTRTACRTSSGWRRASPAPTSSAATTARSCSNAARPTNPLFGAFFDAVQQAGYALTDDVNGYRQEGFAKFDRNIRRGRRLSAARRVPAPGDGRDRTSRCSTRVLTTKVLFDGTRAVGVEYASRGRHGQRARSSAARSSCCGGAFNSPQLLQLSGVGTADHLRGARHRRRARPARRRREHAGPPRGLHPARVHAAGVDGADAREVATAVDRDAVAGAARPGRDQPLRGRRVRAQQRRPSRTRT